MNKILKFAFSAAVLALSCTPGALAQKTTSTSRHSAAHKELLARQGQQVDKIKMLETNKLNDFIDDLEPEIDIYTEGWNSKSVNPYRASEVPDKYTIDVRNYCIPVPGRVTSNYGYRAKFGRMHKGVDLALRSNDTVYAAFDGKVRLTSYEAKGYGNYVIIRHPNSLETVYGHLNKALVKPDQVVKAGQPIGLGGSTGRSTGPHLHFETRFMGYAINPAAIFDFAHKTTHTDTYTFTKTGYTKARDYSPKRETKADDGLFQAAASSPETYVVKKGDTLSSIAKSYGMSATTLRRINDMGTDQTIKVGQTLRLK